MLYVSHRLKEVFDLSSRITVLKDGRAVATLDTVDTSADQLVRHMVGREITDGSARGLPSSGSAG